MAATKCVSKTHGYESTKKGVDASLEKMKFGALIPSPSPLPPWGLQASTWHALHANTSTLLEPSRLR